MAVANALQPAASGGFRRHYRVINTDCYMCLFTEMQDDFCHYMAYLTEKYNHSLQ